MRKHENRTILELSLLAIVGFFALLLLGTAGLQLHQREELRNTASILRADTRPPAWTRMHVVDMKGDSFRARDLRTHTINGQIPKAGAFDVIHPHGVKEMVYYTNVDGRLFALTQRSQNLLNVAPYLLGILTILYWSVFVLLMMVRRKHVQHLREEIQSIARSLRRIRKNEPTQQLLLTPHSRLFPVAQEAQDLALQLERTRHEAHLRRLRFDRLMQNLPQGVMLIDDERNVQIANAAMARMIGKNIANSTHPYIDDIKDYHLTKMVEKVLRKGKFKRRELELSDTERSVEASVVPVNVGNGRWQVLVILYDLTYLRSVERMQTDFVANVSHELKTPITAISGFAETLLNGAKDDPKVLTQFLQIIAKESARLTQLVNDIITLQRGGTDSHVETVNVRQLVEQALQNVNGAITKRNIKTEVVIPSELHVRVDAPRLTQVLHNLVDNAVFYNRIGGAVTVSALRADDNLVLTVRDTGIGVPAAEQSRIFERFYRVDKARSRNNGGTGLGLAIVADAVKDLNGKITLESMPGRGSTFTVTIPVAFTEPLH